MTFVNSWSDFQKSVEQLYLSDPMRFRYVMKYSHKKGTLIVKITDDMRCFQFKTDVLNDLKNINELMGNMMNHMTSRD